MKISLSLPCTAIYTKKEVKGKAKAECGTSLLNLQKCKRDKNYKPKPVVLGIFTVLTNYYSDFF